MSNNSKHDVVKAVEIVKTVKVVKIVKRRAKRIAHSA